MTGELATSLASQPAVVRAESAIRSGRLVAIIRLPRLSAQGARRLTATLVEAGVTALEFTFTTANVLDAITAARDEAGDRAVVGAGTVLSAEQVRQAAEAGAQLIVSPDVNVGVVDATARLGLLSLPGAFTATEVCRAVDAGATMVKLFPAGPGGVEYLKALRGPLPDVAFVPTGGIDLESVGGFISAGAVAVALGSALVSDEDDLPGLAARARRAVQAVGGAR
jgi:2-dehydro-3-deoxyphosphogluconate aldolase / (4S)-4-hydroxy-2-oxoglutarate aldolase